MKHLFKNFLQDKKTYRLNERYYRVMLSDLLAQEARPFYRTAFSNEELFLNGNPIYSTAYRDRVVRIIQKPPSSKPTLRVWLDQFDNLDELVISLELTDRFSPLVRDLAQKWLVDRLPKDKMLVFTQDPVQTLTTDRKLHIFKNENKKIKPKPTHSSEASQLKKYQQIKEGHTTAVSEKVNRKREDNEHAPRARKNKVDVKSKAKK